MRAKGKRRQKQAAMQGTKRNKKAKEPLEFTGGNQSSDSGQTKLDRFYHPAKNQAKGDDTPTSSPASDSTQEKEPVSPAGSSNPTLSGKQNRSKVSRSQLSGANERKTGPAENGDQLDSADGSSPRMSGKETNIKSQKGQKQAVVTSASSKTRTTDQTDLPGTSGDFSNRDGTKVKREERVRSDDQREGTHQISDSESDKSSDSRPVTPKKTTGFLGSLTKSPKRQLRVRTSSPSSWSARDTEAYREGYPYKKDNQSLNDNWKFYNNEIPSKPRGAKIDTMHEHWFGDYSLLEEHHGYIQWLFPIREMGMNWQSQELQLHEAERIRKNPKCKERVVKSYKLMLHFWGMHLKDLRTGTVVRGDNWKERFRHLNRSSHNYLRITRVLKSLGELGFECLKSPFLKFVLQEAIVEGTLANAERSCLQYWLHTLRDDKQRSWMQTYADNLLAETKH